MSKTFYGKYRGTVINNIDPLQIGRIQAMVPDFAGFVPGTWAMPCVPVAGTNTGIFTVPIIGSGVWIEFERGDLDRPIWVGGSEPRLSRNGPCWRLACPASLSDP
jgi:hypothetical protein